VCSADAREDRATNGTPPGLLAPSSGHACAADGPQAAADPSTASFHALAQQVRTTGLLDRRPGYYQVKITLTILAFFASWALFAMAGNSWTTLAVAPLLGIMFTQLAFIGHDDREETFAGSFARSSNTSATPEQPPAAA
jgi:hypothetical protein